MADSALEILHDHLAPLLGGPGPVVVAIDGHSGAGKSTLAAGLAASLPMVPVSVIEGDDFYGGGPADLWDSLDAAGKVDHCIDWRRQRPLLEGLRRGETVRWHPFDWERFEDRELATTEVECRPAPLIILEGVYSARPELADLIDLRVLLDTPAAERRRRLIEREGENDDPAWERRWAEAEAWYFGRIMPPDAFDLVIG